MLVKKVPFALKTFLLMTFLSFAGLQSHAQTNVIPDSVEFAVLKNIYDSLGGPAWTTKTNWPTSGNWPASATSAQFGTWFGVTVANGDITRVDLRANNLIGIFPKSIIQLTKLQVLRLNSNKISGSIPSSIWRLTSLIRIYLYTNLMSGEIPSSIGQLSNLETLYISGNTFSGAIPTEVANLTKLITLYLSSNNFSSFPDLGSLVELVELNMGGNPFPAGPLPSWLQNLTKLTILNFASASRTGDLSPIYGLTQLSSLHLQSNQLTGTISPAIGNLTKLVNLYLNVNQLSGNIPAEIGNLPPLNTLQLSNNQLSGSIPSTIGNLVNLTSLTLSSNQLTGGIPSSIGNLTFLTVLNLSSNQLSGSIPSTFTNLFRLSNVQLQYNKLTGPLPHNIGSMTNLSWFYAHNNQLSGEIPASIGNLPLLHYFNVSANKLEGTIQPTLGNLPNLTYLYLQDNRFTGTIPESLGNLTKLLALSINTNQLTGNLPSTLGNLINLTNLNIGYNQLSGTLPSFIGNYTKMSVLVINNNQFTGDFPAAISGCTSLVTIYGENNKFTSLPSSMLNMSVLVGIRFTNNELVSIPAFQNSVNRPNLGLFVGTNRLDFSQLEPIAIAGLTTFAHYIQRPKDLTTLTVTLGSQFSIPSRPGNFSSLTWEKFNGYTWQTVNGSNADATQLTFTKNSATAADQGFYRWRMYNGNLLGTSVESEPIEVKTEEQQILDTWAFQYQYDARNRMIGKKVPGADWVYMVYDNRDRLVMTQDGELRKTHKWNFTKYDALNRPIITGIYTHTGWATQSTMAGLISTTNFLETYDGSGVHGYTTGVFPISNLEVLTVTYYDNYDFKSLINNTEFDYIATELTDQYQGMATGVAFPKVIGQVTASKTKVLGSRAWYLWSVNYYDDKYRVVQVISENGKSGIERQSSVYDFSGKVLSSKNRHSQRDMNWQIVQGLKSTGTGLNTSIAGWNNQASSVDQLLGDANGWVEMTVADLGLKWLGLDPQAVAYSQIDYGLYITNGLRVYENYVLKETTPIAIGDRVRIERANGVIYYKKNGVVFYQSLVPSSGSLIANLHAYQDNGPLAYENLASSFSSSEMETSRMFAYDHATRLKETWHSINEQAPVLIARNDYNELGQLIQKKLHSTDAVASEEDSRTYKQNVDYRYNIRGWLERINNSDLAKEQIGNNAEPRDYFGMNLGYNASIGLSGAGYQFNGNISAIKYSTNLALGFNDAGLEIFEPTERGYKFTYDQLNRLETANHAVRTTAWNDAPSFNESISLYDLNGNIKNLSRTGKDASPQMDNLAYTYLGNQLLKVADAGNKQEGFKDSPSIDDDYAYDANGNMTMDRNKSINPGGIKYNYLNLPIEVAKSTGDKIVYIYDATGRKLTQNVLNPAGAIVKKTNYVGEYIYENDTAKIIQHEEGRIIPEADGSFTYDYNLKDHLGNVRLTFTTKDEVEETTATLETANIAEEQSQYLRYENARLVQSTLFDRTNGASPGYAQRLRGSGNEIYGLARSLSVMPGDTVNVEVYAKYFQPDPVNTQALNDFIAALAAGTLPAGSVIDGGGYGSSTSGFSYGGIVANSPAEGAPKAYLNWIVFDRNVDVKDFGFMPVTTAAKETGSDGAHERLFKDNIVIREPGYIYIYLSNEENTNPVEVFFDDFKVEHVKSAVVQTDEYYPFGLIFNSYARENNVTQNYLYNSKELQDELNLGWYDYGARMYMADIGRWGVVDPMSELTFLSPFNYVENNPVNLIDPTGMFSTHTDEKGNVISVYQDGDLGVYKHEKNADGGSVTEAQLDKRHKKSTSAGGEKMGETVHELSFADFDNPINNNGSVNAVGQIDFESTWAGDQIDAALGEITSFVGDYTSEATGQGKYNLKAHSPNGSIYYGSQVSEGIYGSARDAGNILAGAAAAQTGLTYEGAMEGFGALNVSRNNKLLGGLTLLINQMTKNKETGYNGWLSEKPYYGENTQSGKGIEYGYKKYTKK
jgi:RHS repeat-associated protein